MSSYRRNLKVKKIFGGLEIPKKNNKRLLEQNLPLVVRILKKHSLSTSKTVRTLNQQPTDKKELSVSRTESAKSSSQKKVRVHKSQ